MLIAHKQTENACQTRTHHKHACTVLRTLPIDCSIRQSPKWHQLTVRDMQKQYECRNTMSAGLPHSRNTASAQPVVYRWQVSLSVFHTTLPITLLIVVATLIAANS